LKSKKLIATLTLALAGQAWADRLPCSGLECVLAVPGAVVYLGVQSLRPTPPIVFAVRAIKAGNSKDLEALLKKYPELIHPENQQQASFPQDALTDGDGIEDSYLLSPSKASAFTLIQGAIRYGNADELEHYLKANPEFIQKIDNAYVLLASSAKWGNRESVKILLDAGVPANLHCNGALLHARNADIAKLLLERGASPKGVNLRARQFFPNRTTAFALAIESQDQELIDMLTYAGAGE
jgi:ankyrin repeat protein